MGTRITPASRPPNPRNCRHYADEPSAEVEVVCTACLAERARVESARIPPEKRQTWLWPREVSA